MEVSRDLPFLTATALEPPVPRWHATMRERPSGTPASSAAARTTYW